MGKIAFVNFGKQLRDRKKYTTDVIKVPGRAAKASLSRVLYGRDVSRYDLRWGGLACLDDEQARCGGCWDPQMQNAKEKLVTRQIGKCPLFGIDLDGFQCLNTVFMVNPKQPGLNVRFLLGILNSKLLRGYWVQRFYDQRRTFPKIKGTYLKKLPICKTTQATRVNETVTIAWFGSSRPCWHFTNSCRRPGPLTTRR